MRVYIATGSPRLLPTLGAVPRVEQSEVWIGNSGVSCRRIEPLAAAWFTHPPLPTGLGVIAQPGPS